MAINKFLNFVSTTTIGNRIEKIGKCNRFEFKKTFLNIKKLKARNLLSMQKNLNASTELATSNNEVAQTLLKELDNEVKQENSQFNVFIVSNKKIVSIVAMFFTIAGGWFFTPTRKKIISLIISFLVGGLAFFSIRNMSFKNNVSVQSKIIENILTNNNDKSMANEISEIQKKSDMSSSEIKTEVRIVYKKFLSFYLRNTSISYEEVEQLVKIKSILGINEQEIGQSHHEFAKDLYKSYIVLLERDESGETDSIVNKFFFLSDKILSKDSQKGYQYEFSRIVKTFLLSQPEIKQMCNDQSKNLYKKNIDSLIKSKVYENLKIEEIATILDIEDRQRDVIHSDYLSEKIQSVLVKDGKISSEGKSEIQELCNLLSISDEQQIEAIMKQTRPLYSDDLYNFFTKEKDVENSAQLILSKQKEYFLTEDCAIEEYFNASGKAINYFIENLFNNSKNLREIDNITGFENLFDAKKNIANVFNLLNFSKSNKDSRDLSSFIDKTGAGYNSGKALQIYEYLVKFSLKEGVLTDENSEKLQSLSQIFSISSDETEKIYDNIASPIYMQKIGELIDSKSFTSQSKEIIKNFENSLKINSRLALESKTNLYKNKLDEVLDKVSILSEKDLEFLNNIRLFLNLRWENVQNIHNAKSEPIFYKSVTEAMGATGVIPVNYWQGLEKLRKRLQLTEGKAKEIFYRAVREKLKIIFEKAIVENKKKNQPQQANGTENNNDPTVQKGSGTALGIEAGNEEGNELFNLVDLYFRNNIYIDKGVSLNETKKNTMKGLPGRSEVQLSSKSKPDFIYPVSLDGLFDKKTVSNMYRQYLVDCFSAKLQSEKRRLFNNLEKLGPILGLDEKEITNIHSNVGMVIFQKFLSQALSKGYLDKSDTSFLASIQATLSMNNKECNDLIKNGKKSSVNLAVEKIFASPKIDPSSVTKTRNMALQFGIDLASELNISLEQRSKLFRIELDSGIEEGIITNESQNLIGEIQIAYGLEDDVTKRILAECITNKSEGHLINAIASLRRKSENEALNEIQKMLNFGNLLPLTIEASVGSVKEKTDLYDLYFSTRTTKPDQFSEEKTLNLLKLMLNLN
jgi:hypothetical protein